MHLQRILTTTFTLSDKDMKFIDEIVDAINSSEDVHLDGPKFKKRKRSDGAMEDEQLPRENNFIACT